MCEEEREELWLEGGGVRYVYTDDYVDQILVRVAELQSSHDALKAQLDYYRGLKPVAWRVFDGDGGYDYCGYTDNEDYRDEFIKRNPSPTYKNWVEPLYALEKK